MNSSLAKVGHPLPERIVDGPLLPAGGRRRDLVDDVLNKVGGRRSCDERQSSLSRVHHTVPVQKRQSIKRWIPTRNKLIRSSSPSNATALLPLFDLEKFIAWLFVWFQIGLFFRFLIRLISFFVQVIEGEKEIRAGQTSTKSTFAVTHFNAIVYLDQIEQVKEAQQSYGRGVQIRPNLIFFSLLFRGYWNQISFKFHKDQGRYSITGKI